MVNVIEEVSPLTSHEIYMDNFFSSCKLMRDLRKRNLRATGIIRSNRLKGVPIKHEKELRERGNFHSVSDGKLCIIRLHDSKVVTLITNFDTVEPLRKTKRRNKAAPLATYNLPNAFRNYNNFMGGVDLSNRFLVDYDACITGKKWYWPLFIHWISMMRTAAWRISAHANHGRPPLDQLRFLRSLVQVKVVNFIIFLQFML